MASVVVTLDALEERIPEVNWRRPLAVTVPGVGSGLACRVCIAAVGFRGFEVRELPQTREEWEEHFRATHAAEPDVAG